MPTSVPAPVPTVPTAPTPSTCPYVQCNFGNLVPGVFLDDPLQQAQLLADCGVKVSVKDGNINVFDSADIKSQKAKDDPDLGAPNRNCLGGGPGKGEGGRPTSPYPNCDPQGNLLIIQNPKIDASVPNDSAFGGCILFEFETAIELFDVGLLDLEEHATIRVGICLQ
jgi:hypothetical protein